jgi:hypothetical protein
LQKYKIATKVGFSYFPSFWREWQKSELGHPPLKLRQQFPPPFEVEQSKKGDYGALGDLRVREGGK